jgi:DNA-binding GntR family transcriptional regulator
MTRRHDERKWAVPKLILGDDDHLYDVTKEIQDATVRLSTDRFRQAKINRLQSNSMSIQQVAVLLTMVRLLLN